MLHIYLFLPCFFFLASSSPASLPPASSVSCASSATSATATFFPFFFSFSAASAASAAKDSSQWTNRLVNSACTSSSRNA
ncbi:hypothetical protein V8C86DRAFT_794181 [Haematococcus lacustris]